MAISVHKRKRIPLLFLIGIGIPCLLLGYLAFRGIQNDQALLEKERQNEHLKISELVTGAIDEKILITEQAFNYILSKYPDIHHAGLISSMDSLKNKYPVAEEVFFTDTTGRIYLPAAKFLFIPDGTSQPFSSLSQIPASVRKVPAGQQLEFQQKNYPRAIASYQQEFERVIDPQIKGEMLSAIARVQKKSALCQEALKTYEVIARDYSNIPTAGGVPLGLAARMEISSLELAAGDTLNTLETCFNLYKNLLDREWSLERAQYDFFSQNIKEVVDTILSQVSLTASLRQYLSAFDTLKEEEKSQLIVTDRLLEFRENTANGLQAKASLNPGEPLTSPKRFTLESGEYTYLVSLSNQYTSNESQINQVHGLLLDVKYLRDSILRQTLERNVHSGKTGWIVKGRNEETILKSENPTSGSSTVRTNFEGGFPPWSVEFYQNDSDLLQTFLFSRRGVYFYMFILLAGILIFGLILTTRTVSHELELSKMKSDFVSTVSHEFKSPLSSIRQLSEMLQSGRVPSEERRQQYYDVLVEQSERLTLLIDNILDFAKIEEGKKKFDFEMVDISLLLKETVSAIQDQVHHKDFIIKVEAEKSLPSIKADREAIIQTITNLIDNATKYSGESRNIIVRAFVENKYLIIAVKDFGIGIRKEEIDKVFERFYRGGDELTRTVKGSGLGLTLVKQIVEAHHGKIEVESEVGKGSRFIVRIPLPGI